MKRAAEEGGARCEVLDRARDGDAKDQVCIKREKDRTKESQRSVWLAKRKERRCRQVTLRFEGGKNVYKEA